MYLSLIETAEMVVELKAPGKAVRVSVTKQNCQAGPPYRLTENRRHLVFKEYKFHAVTN